jgi:hypothetical protein
MGRYGVQGRCGEEEPGSKGAKGVIPSLGVQ